MSNELTTKPSPIQRNLNDVAVELTQLFYKSRPPQTVQEIQETYFKFYSIAQIASNDGYKIDTEFIPENIRNKFK